jgi:hypothetical protein
MAHRPPEPTNPRPETTDRIRETTDQLPRRRIGLRSPRIERRADTSSGGADIPVPEAGGRIPPQASSTPTRAAGRPTSARTAEVAARPVALMIRAVKVLGGGSSSGGGRRARASGRPTAGCTTERTARRPHRAESSAQPTFRWPRERSGPASDDQPAAAMTSTPRARGSPAGASRFSFQPARRVGRPLRVGSPSPVTRRACGPSIQSLRSAPQRARVRPRPNRPRVRAHLHRACDVPHAAPESVCCVALRATSRVQALAHVMHLRPRDRVISPCEPDPSRSIMVMEKSRRGMPGHPGMRTHVRGRYEGRRT